MIQKGVNDKQEELVAKEVRNKDKQSKKKSKNES